MSDDPSESSTVRNYGKAAMSSMVSDTLMNS
jgi:hypothetical protein